MLDKDATLISVLAGMFGYIAKRYIDANNGIRLTWWQLIVEAFISGGLGYVAFWVARDLGHSEGVSAAVAGIVGHLGNDVFTLLKLIIYGRIKVIAGMANRKRESKGEQNDPKGNQE